MMGTISNSVRKKRTRGSVAPTRFRKLIFQELDRRVCFNVDYGDEATLSIDLEPSQRLLEQQISFLSQISALNSAREIVLPVNFAEAVLQQIQQLSFQLRATAQDSDQGDPQSVSQSDTSDSPDSQSTNDNVIAQTSAEHSAIFGNQGSDLVTLDWAFNSAVYAYYASVEISDADGRTSSVTLSTVRGNEDLYDFVFQVDGIPNQSTLNPVGQSDTANSNPVRGDFLVTAPKPGQQLDTALSTTSVPPATAPMVAAPVVTSPSTTVITPETRSNGLILQPSLPSRSPSSLSQPETGSSSQNRQGWGDATTNWFVGKVAGSEKDNRRDGKLISSRQDPPAARMQRAHMTIARSRSVAEIATVQQVAVSPKAVVEKSTPTSAMADSSQNTLNADVNLHNSDSIPTSSLSDAQKLMSNNQVGPAIESYFGNLQSVREAIQNSSKSPQNLLPQETPDSDFTAVIRKQIPLAAVIAVGTLASRFNIERSHSKRPKGDFQLAEKSDNSYPA